MGPAVFFDRDGVLNDPIVIKGKPFSPMRIEEFSLVPEARASCTRLKKAGFALVVVTNQPEVSRGNLEVEELNAMHEILYQELGIDLVMACPHDSLDECACRKPLPGMLVEASKTLEIRLDKSWLIGDRWKDIAAGEATGCQTIFLDRGYDEEKPVSQNFTRSTLKDAVDTVLRNFSLPNEEF